MIENRQDGEIESYIASMKALNPDANMKKVGILKTAGPKVCTVACIIVGMIFFQDSEETIPHTGCSNLICAKVITY